MTLSGYFHQYMLEMRSERREFLERFEEGPLLWDVGELGEVRNGN